MPAELPAYLETKWKRLTDEQLLVVQKYLALKGSPYCCDDLYVLEKTSWKSTPQLKIALISSGMPMEVSSVEGMYSFITFMTFTSFFRNDVNA